jgi:hypothetical protein
MSQPRRLPVFPWFFLAVQILFLVLVIAAAGQDLDPGLSPGLVAIAWLVADVLLGLGCGLYRLARARR